MRLHAFDRTNLLPERGIELVPVLDFTRVIVVVSVIVGLKIEARKCNSAKDGRRKIKIAVVDDANCECIKPQS
jgi:hypothetical protein